MSTRRSKTRKGSRQSAKTGNTVNIKVDGILDLHHFKPKEVPELVQDYLQECYRRNISEIRIIHGKGKGVLRAIVQDILANNPHVITYGSPPDRSGWGATIASLRTKTNSPKLKARADEKDKEQSRSPARSFWRRLWPWQK